MKQSAPRTGALPLLRWLLLCLIFVEIAGCTVSRNPISGRKRVYGYTWDQERQLGAQADQQIVQQMGVYEDPELQQYVERIGERVLAESHLRAPDADEQFRATPFTFRVIDSPVVNAFALPGGFVYVTRGLLTHLNNEAQLAVVLGHEIVHVAGRHASQRAFEAQAGQLGVITGAILGQAVLGGAAGRSILDLGGTAAQLLLLSYGRDDERESDRHGVAYAAQAGYDAAEAAEFFVSLKRLGERTGSALPSFLSTHPDPGEREETIRRLAADWRERANATRIARDEFYQRLEGTIVGDDPRQGFVEDGVFYHPELRFRFPAPQGFVVDNGRTQVTMVETASQQAAIVFSIAANASTAQEGAAQLLNQSGITVQDSRGTSVNGLSAFAATATAQLESGQQVALLTYFIEYGGRVYYFVGFTPVNQFSNYRQTFQRVMEGFAPESSTRVLSVQPKRIQVVTANRTAPFSAFIPSDLPTGMSAGELAILNQVGLDEQIQAGTPLKLPR